jgi:hypothetical protein
MGAVLGLALAAGCGGDGRESDMPRVSPPDSRTAGRNFSRAELDSLRALKERNRVTRDEYWDDRGGVLGNDVVDVWYPPGNLTVSHGMYVLDWAMKCRRQAERLFGRVPQQKLTIVCTQTMEAYTDFTGREWWHYASIEDDRIIYQPVPVLVARGLLDIALPREYFEWAIERIAGDEAPRWLVEGMASRLANEETVLEDNLGEFPDEAVKMELGAIEAALDADDDKKRARIAYYNAYMMVKRLDQEFSRGALAAMITAIGDGSSLESAARSAFELPYDELVTRARGWTPPTGDNGD